MREPGRPAYLVVSVREPGRGSGPIQIEPGDRVRLVIEGTVESVEQGILGGGLPVLVTDAGRRVETNYPMLGAARVEVLAPADGPDEDFPGFPDPH
ncbi:hypothetical protein [Nocardioides pakistanensis]